jgi:hypothetical protein
MKQIIRNAKQYKNRKKGKKAHKLKKKKQITEKPIER